MLQLHLRIVIVLATLLTSLTATASRYNFRNFSVAEGLAQSRVGAMAQDEQGFIWAGTNGGLSRFNGKTFRNFYVEDGLPYNRISALCSTPGNLWVGTQQGIAVYNGQKFQRIGEKTGLYLANIRKLLYGNGLTYAITSTEVYAIRELVPGGKFSIDSLNARNFSVMPQFTAAVLDTDKNLWLACSDEGVYALIWNKSRISANSRQIWATTTGRFNGKPVEVIHLNNDTNQFGRNITSLTLDLGGNIWFCDLAEGVGRILLAEGKPLEVQSTLMTPNGAELFPKFRYYDIFCDSYGSIWAGTDGAGMVRLKQGKEKGKYTYSPDQLYRFEYNSGLRSNHPIHFFEDDERNLWIGTLNEGISRLNGEKFITHIPKERFDGDNTMCVYEDSYGAIWSGTYGGGIYRHMPNDSTQNYLWERGICESIITSITEDKFHNLYCATVGGGISILPYANRDKKENAFVCLNTENGLPWDFVSVLFTDRNGQVWTGMQSGGGVSMITANGPGGAFSVVPLAEEEEVLKKGRVTSIYQQKSGDVWVACTGGLIQFSEAGKIKIVYSADQASIYGDVNCITEDFSGNLWMGTGNNGIWIHKNNHTIRYTPEGNGNKDEFVTTQNLGLSNNIITGFLRLDKILWVTTRMGVNRISFRPDGSINAIRSYSQDEGLNTVEINNNAITSDRDKNIWIGTTSGVTKFITAFDVKQYPTPHLNIEQILLNYKDIHDYMNPKSGLPGLKFDSLSGWFGFPINLELGYSQNHITFVYSGIQHSAPERISYQFKLDGFDTDWSPPTVETRAVYSGLEPGQYTFRVKACNADGIWMQEPVSYQFRVLAPFYRTWWFYLLIALVVLGGILAAFWLRERSLRQSREKLETLVQERTAETVLQKEELEKQSMLIQAKNRDITSSIEYAQRIQQAILPETEQLRNYFSEYFMIFQPRDIVSGDFYWIAEKDEVIYVAAVDCTGHGVPGAFMSLISYNLLNEALIVSSMRISDVLENLRMSLYSQLKKYDEESIIYDGLDISLISYDPRTQLLAITNSNRPVFMVSGNELTHIKSCKTTIGGVQYSTTEKFDTTQMQVQKGDKIYLFTDGYTDQFGGPRNKRLGRASFERLLLEISDFTMEEQRKLIHDKYEDWRGINEQMDDMLVIGLEF